MMNMCEFCDGREKRIKNGFTYGNAHIAKNNFGYSYSLRYDNSANEYGEGAFEINYCPICGRKLVCNMYEHCCNEYKQIIDDREKDSILYISDSEKDIRIFLEYLKKKMDNNGKECFLDGEHDILKTKNYNVVCKSIYGTQLGIGYGYCLHYCFSSNFDKSKCNDMKKYSIAEILAHTREGAKEISELDILYMLGLV